MTKVIFTPPEELVKQMSQVTGVQVVTVAKSLSPTARSFVVGIESLLPKDFELNTPISVTSDNQPVAAQNLPNNSTKDTERTV
jgi:hypothetical protein